MWNLLYNSYEPNQSRVEMRYFIGFEMEMEFVKFMLACATVLMEIFIWNIGHFHWGTQMTDEMKQFHQESPNVRFKFEEICTGMELDLYLFIDDLDLFDLISF